MKNGFKNKIHWIFALLIAGFIVSCVGEAPRDNPLDPAIDGSLLHLQGQVLTFYQPREAIAGAVILLQPGNLVVVSNLAGEYRFSNLKSGEYTLICQADSYHADSVTINLQSNREYSFLLDGLPQFEKILITAHHRSRWFPRDELYYIELETIVSDPDGIGDIRSVIYKISSMNIADPLQPGIEAGKFSTTLFDTDLPVASVHQLIGREIYFIVEDDFEINTTSEAKYLTRIIEQTPTLITPVELQSIESLPINFEWDRVLVPYPATLSIEIFQINLGIPFKVDDIEEISINDHSYSYSKNLNQGDYFWTLNIVDEFGNSSSSREGTFQIK